MDLFLTTIQQLATKDSKISYSQQKNCRFWLRIQSFEFKVNNTQSDVQGYTMEDFKNCKLEFLKQQEKQRQEDLKQQQKQRQEDLKRLYESTERQEERFRKLIQYLTKENDSENLNTFRKSQ